MTQSSEFDRRRFLMRTSGLASAGAAGVFADPLASLAAPKKLRTKSAAPKQKTLADMTIADFTALVGEKFTTTDERYRVTLVLKEVISIKVPNDPNRPKELRKEPFSLLFHARNFNELEPAIYHLTNSKLGEVDLFLQKVRADDDPATVHYEAVFN